MHHQAANSQKRALLHHRAIGLIMITRLIEDRVDAIEIDGVAAAVDLDPKPAIGAGQCIHGSNTPVALIIRESQHRTVMKPECYKKERQGGDQANDRIPKAAQGGQLAGACGTCVFHMLLNG